MSELFLYHKELDLESEPQATPHNLPNHTDFYELTVEIIKSDWRSIFARASAVQQVLVVSVFSVVL